MKYETTEYKVYSYQRKQADPTWYDEREVHGLHRSRTWSQNTKSLDNLVQYMKILNK